jgi:RNA polymerase sigma factor (sigma-70 family)
MSRSVNLAHCASLSNPATLIGATLYGSTRRNPTTGTWRAGDGPRSASLLNNYQLEIDQREALLGFIDQLPSREAEIIRWRYGVDGRDALTHQQCAKKFKISRQRVGQLEKRAIKRLRELAAEGPSTIH